MRYRHATSADYPELVRIAAVSAHDNTDAMARGQGFLTGYFDAAKFATFDADLGVFVADDGGEVAGFLCAATRDFAADVPILRSMLVACRQAEFEGRQTPLRKGEVMTELPGISRRTALKLGTGGVAAGTLPLTPNAAQPPSVDPLPKQAVEDPLLAEAVDLSGAVMFLESGAPGMVLAVVQGPKSIVRGYGETTKGNGHVPDGKSLVRLNSITKVFAGEMLAELASSAGKFHLTDPLQLYAGNVRVPTFGTHRITLLDLATHTAALPRDMGEEPPGVPPRTWPTEADRWKWLPGYRLPWAPGTNAAYSNVGFDLLADAIGKAGGRPYPSLLREHITAPLGMIDTGFSPTPDQCARLMTGSGLGGPGPCVDTGATDGSGGLYSTADDMVLWLRHNIADSDGRLALSHAVYRQRQTLKAAIGFDEAGPMAGLGLGWVVVAGHGINPTLIEKSGGGVGFMSYIAFAPGRNVGAFIAVSRVDFAMFAALAAAANGLIANLTTR